jgi:RluA family pseudouridine synthase
MKLHVKAEDRGLKLLPFLRKHCAHLSSVKGLKRAIDTKHVVVNGRIETFSTHPLKVGDTVEIKLAEAPSKPITILYEDDALLICNKPAGAVSDNSLFPRCHLVHRLDKETSGALIFAKTAQVKEQMIELFRAFKIEKRYLAVVDGKVSKESGTIESNLAKKHSYVGQTIYGSAPTGQRAITLWKCLSRSADASLVECFPKTGRTHQLRVHLKELGHPILGDTQYSRIFHCPYKPTRILLHASHLSFPHPKTGAQLDVAAPLPDDFEVALVALKLK